MGYNFPNFLQRLFCSHEWRDVPLPSVIIRKNNITSLLPCSILECKKCGKQFIFDAHVKKTI